MRDAAELRLWFGADTLCRRIGRDQLGMFAFERAQPIEKFVVLAVRNFRIIEHVVAVVVVIDGCAQRIDFFAHLAWGLHHDSQIRVVGNGQIYLTRVAVATDEPCGDVAGTVAVHEYRVDVVGYGCSG